MAKEQVTREQVAEDMTWDLSDAYATDEQFEAELQAIADSLPQFARFKGTLGQSSDNLLAAIEEMHDVWRRLMKAYTYSHLKNDQDISNSTYQSFYQKAMMLYAQVQETFAFFEPELLALPEGLVEQFINENESLQVYRHMLNIRLARRPHVLSDKEETLLSAAADIFDASHTTASVLNNVDMKLPEVHDPEGDAVRLTHGLYSQLLESSNRAVREEAFKGMYASYEGLKNTFASTLSTTVKYHNFDAKVHNYPSARAAALASNHVPEQVYDTLVDVVNKHLPLLHRYMKLRKKVLGLDELHMYDLHTPIVGDEPIRFTIEEAQEMTLKALAPLGEEYQALLKRAFSERWIDWVENKGKRSGAYSSGAYDTKPYILMNWHDSIDHLYTLVHELGHSLHSHYTRTTQPFVYGYYSIFLAEIASTTNENLLTEYLLKTIDDPKVKLFVLNHYLDGVKGTVFRQTQFAEFEHLMHELAASGTPLTQDVLSAEYAKINAKYYGDDVVQDEEIAYEWARIPHFYYNYYVFQYATGFSAASALADAILTEGEPALTRYLDYLKAGSSDFPIEVMKKAGIDMTQADYIESALKVFEQRLEELEQLLA